MNERALTGLYKLIEELKKEEEIDDLNDELHIATFKLEWIKIEMKRDEDLRESFRKVVETIDEFQQTKVTNINLPTKNQALSLLRRFRADMVSWYMEFSLSNIEERLLDVMGEVESMMLGENIEEHEEIVIMETLMQLDCAMNEIENEDLHSAHNIVKNVKNDIGRIWIKSEIVECLHELLNIIVPEREDEKIETRIYFVSIEG